MKAFSTASCPPTVPSSCSPDIYRLQFDFLGISLEADPGETKSQYKLEGHHPDWNTTTSTSALYVGVPDGEYTFLVRACRRWTAAVPKKLRRRHIHYPHARLETAWYLRWLCIAAGLLIIDVTFRTRECNQRLARRSCCSAPWMNGRTS